MVNKAWQTGVLKHPLSEDFGEDFPIIQYANDTLLILPGDAKLSLTSKVYSDPSLTVRGYMLILKNPFWCPSTQPLTEPLT
jgi:hypothetical protein